MIEKESFSLLVDGVFFLKLKGTIITGRITTGSIKIGDKLKISGNNNETFSRCIGLEKHLRHISEAKEGEYIGIIISDVADFSIKTGMKVSVIS